MSTLKLAISLITLLIVFTGCNENDDDNPMETYTSEDLNLLHNNSSKTWKLEAYYERHDSQISSLNDCFIDDTYIFKTDNEVEVISGGESCHYGNSEIAEARYRFYAEEGMVFFTMIRGKITNNVVRSTFFSLKLIALEEDRMVFASGDKSNYERALIFVKN
jgi:hypothetical protein